MFGTNKFKRVAGDAGGRGAGGAAGMEVPALLVSPGRAPGGGPAAVVSDNICAKSLLAGGGGALAFAFALTHVDCHPSVVARARTLSSSSTRGYRRVTAA